MKAAHKTALATAVVLVLMGAGSIMYGPQRDAPAAVAVQEVSERARDLIVPIAGVALTALNDSWGAPRAEGRQHEGVDIMAPAGTPVRAAASGTIAKLYLSKRGGITVYQFDETRKVILYYAHLQGYETGIDEGKRVAQGQVIGYVGSTGNATTPHLHFEVQRADVLGKWWLGEAVNPYQALRAGTSKAVYASGQHMTTAAAAR